ncbi:acyl-CoA dehydrogenase family protein, partial [Frankia sp. CpI1-P]
MERTLYGDDHELFRESVRAFVERFVSPGYSQFIADRVITRDVWHEAGRA